MAFELEMPNDPDNRPLQKPFWMMSWREKYEFVINSPRWRELRTRLIGERGGKCQRCKEEKPVLQLHHLTYERLGSERDSDLEVLCLDCHAIADSQRAALGRSDRTWPDLTHGRQKSTATTGSNTKTKNVSQKNLKDGLSDRTDFAWKR